MPEIPKLSASGTRFAVEQDAVSATEYAILLALLVLVCVAAIGGIGARVINIYTAIDNSMPEGF